MDETTEFDHIEAVLIDLAKPLDLDALNRHDDGSWALTFGQDDVIEAFYDPDRKELSLFKELTAPKDEVRAKVHTMALQFNYLWRSTGGGRLSAVQEDGPLTYSVDINFALCDVPYLKKVILNVQDTCKGWAVIIENASGEDGPSEMPDMSGWIKM